MEKASGQLGRSVTYAQSLPVCFQNFLFLTVHLPQAAKAAKEYEERGGDYENEPGSKDKPKKGPPEQKSETTKAKEMKESKRDYEIEEEGEFHRTANRELV